MITKEMKTFAAYVANKAGFNGAAIEALDEDLRGIYFRYNENDYYIRTWNIDGNTIIDYTLCKMVKDKSGWHGETVLNGKNYYICDN